MRCFALLLLLALIGGAHAAPNALDIQCIRVGSLPAPTTSGTPVDPGELYCGGDHASVVPRLAMGNDVTVVLKSSADCDATKPYLLLVDGMATGVVADGCNTEQRTLSFQLGHTPSPHRLWAVDPNSVRLLWRRLLGNPWDSVDWQRGSWLSVQQWNGTEAPIVSAQKPILLRLIDITADRGIAAIAILAALIGILFKLVRKDKVHLLRDRGVLVEAGNRPFSLARIQMAWWFGLIFVAYVFLWVVCAELPALSSSALVLLGIAGGTGIIGTSMDASNQSLQPSKGWLLDVTSDTQGVTLYRLQHLVWNAFFGLAFIIQVASTLAIPEFDNTALGLMGISAAAYLGFKVPESKTDSEPSAPSAAADPKSGYGTS